MDDIKDNLGEVSNETPSLDNSQEDDPKAIRHAQLMAGSKAEAERLEKIALDAQVELARQNAKYLLELSTTDLKLANKVAQAFGYSSFELAKEKILSGEAIQKQQEDDFDIRYQNKRAEEKHLEAVELANSFISKTKLDNVQKEMAKTYFDNLTKGKTLTSIEALEIADMATLYVQKEKIKEGNYQEGLKEFASTGVSSSKKVTVTKSDDEPYEVVRDGKIVLLTPNKSKKGTL